MSAHSPGPWKLTYGGHVEAASGEYIVGFHWDSFKEFDELSEKNKANCRLIAAAPELLAALQAILPFCAKTSASEGGAAKYSASVSAADMVRAAIAKATGSAS